MSSHSALAPCLQPCSPRPPPPLDAAMPHPTAADTLASFIADLRYEHLPADAIHQANRMLLDTVGCALAAWREDPRKARIARDLAEEFASPGQSTIIGGHTTHPALAALANGILANA